MEIPPRMPRGTSGILPIQDTCDESNALFLWVGVAEISHTLLSLFIEIALNIKEHILRSTLLGLDVTCRFL